MKIKPSLWKKIEIKFIINFSRNIPKKYKFALKSKLISNFEPLNTNLTKGLFRSLITEDAYDIFTSSILAFHLNNWLSIQILNRAQIEMFLFTHWLTKNPKEIKNIFNEEVYGKNGNLKKYFKAEKNGVVKFFWESYNKFYSKKAHPLPGRFIKSISFMSYMKPRKENLDLKLFLGKSFNKLPETEKKKIISESFEFGDYSPGVSSVPHKKDKNMIDFLIIQTIYLHNEILKNLEKIDNNSPDYKMSKENWDLAIRKYNK